MPPEEMNYLPNETPQLPQLINSHTARARETVANWEEAARVIGELLNSDHSIQPGYIDAMIRTVYELGPYVVLAPGIALLHARPEDGVLKPCMALVTLAKPVPFGHSQNDPVDLVVAFGAVDKKRHIQALQQLAMLLADEPAVAALRSASSDEELVAVIRDWSGRANPDASNQS